MTNSLFCLEALSQLSRILHDPDTALFPALLEGVTTGYQEPISVSVDVENWKSAEERCEVVDELIAEELSKGWIFQFAGTLDEARQMFPMGVAVGKLGLALSDNRPPRLVVDSSICGTNANCEVLECQTMPSAKDVLRTYPLRNNREELNGLSLDVKAAHKRVVIKQSHRGLLGFSHRKSLYFYRVAPFGAVFSAHWWGRISSFWVRLLHQAIFALFLFVDDFLLLQRKDVLPLTAAFTCALMQAFLLPISWRKAELAAEIHWIGWHFNFSVGTVHLQAAKRTKLLDLISHLLQHGRVSKKTLEKFLGLALSVTQLFPPIRSPLHYLFHDLHSAPGTLYSVDPGYWLTTISCLDNNLQFTTRPVGTAIPRGSKLFTVRHQPVRSLEDVQECKLTEKRIWVRVLDPTSSRRSLSTDSKRVLSMYQHWLTYASPLRSMMPLQRWTGEAAADACAHDTMLVVI